jgi:hypothetical protein
MRSLMLTSLIFLTLLETIQKRWKSNAFSLSTTTFCRKATNDQVLIAARSFFKPKKYIHFINRDNVGALLLASGDFSDLYERNVDRTCLRRFLTQRSVQSFMFLCQECRDPHTIRWLDEFGNTTDLVYYHGTGAIDPNLFKNWDSYFLQMMERPDDFITVQARRRGRGMGGWSKDNPYLQVRDLLFLRMCSLAAPSIHLDKAPIFLSFFLER